MFAAGAAALFVVCFSLIHPVVNWFLLAPAAIIGLGLLFIAWEIASGDTWRNIMDSILNIFYWP